MQREQMGAAVNPMLIQIYLAKAVSETTSQLTLTNTVLSLSSPLAVHLILQHATYFQSLVDTFLQNLSYWS